MRIELLQTDYSGYSFEKLVSIQEYMNRSAMADYKLYLSKNGHYLLSHIHTPRITGGFPYTTERAKLFLKNADGWFGVYKKERTDRRWERIKRAGITIGIVGVAFASIKFFSSPK